jgi:hypothetical protein
MSISALKPSRLTFIWLVLIGATLLSWNLGAIDGPAKSTAYRGDSVLLMLVVFFKARLVMRDFMEVRSAPVALRTACDAWLLCLCALILIFYVWGSSIAAAMNLK